MEKEEAKCSWGVFEDKKEEREGKRGREEGKELLRECSLGGR